MNKSVSIRSMTRRLAATGVVTILLAACSLEPAYEQPSAPIAASFPGGDSYPSLPNTPTGVAELHWQDFFTDPKLKKTIELALSNSRDLRVAITNIEAAQAKYHIQRSELFPTIDAGGGVTYSRQQVASPTGALVDENEKQYTTTVGVTSYELDLFGRIRSLSDSQLELYLATEEARRTTQISLIAETASDYVTLNDDMAQLTAAKANLVSSQNSLDITEARLKAGVASQLDVSQANTVVQQARASVAQYTTTVATDKNALDLVVGATVPPELLPDGISDQKMVMETLPVGINSDVLLGRPDVLEAEHTLKSANAQIGAARAAFFPTISLTGSVGTTSVALSQLFMGPAAVWSYGPSISVPIFDGGYNEATLDYDKAERKVDLAKYEKAIQTAFSEVANALARRGTIAEEVSADQALVEAAATSLKLSTARYEQGSDTYLNVLSAQRTLYSAQQTLISIRLTQATNLVTIYKTLGGGGDVTE
jgi:multidrug efflux system outer membrane protein